jgi:transposase
MKDNLETANRDELLAIIAQQAKVLGEQAQRIGELEQCVASLRAALKARVGSGGAEEPPDEEGEDEAASQQRPKRKRAERSGQPRRKRTRNYARRRSTPTRQVVHAVEQCRHCGCTLRGGSVKRRREVLHVPIVPVEVIEHVFIERRCPQCGRRETPGAEVLAGEVLGKHRVSVQTMGLIANWREEGRLPIEVIQWLLRSCFQLELSQGELVDILQCVARKAEPVVEQIRQQVQASRVVHGDETFWSEDGQGGYMWSFSTPRESYFAYRHSRAGQVVEDILGPQFDNTLVTDFYSAYHRHQGPHQRCWVHLLRAVHELKEAYPDDEQVQAWGAALHALYKEACQYRERHREAPWIDRLRAAQRFEQESLALCAPYLDQKVPQRTLCRRVQRFLNELFTFVVDPEVPPDNNAAERAIRPLAVSRKISGGTRSPRGSWTKAILASLFGTWRLRGLDPFMACVKLLASPHF